MLKGLFRNEYKLLRQLCFWIKADKDKIERDRIGDEIPPIHSGLKDSHLGEVWKESKIRLDQRRVRNDLKLATASEWRVHVYGLTGTSTYCASCLVRCTSRISYASGKKGKYVYLWIKEKDKRNLDHGRNVVAIAVQRHRHQARIWYEMEIKIYLNLEKSVFVLTPPRINIRGKQSRWVSHFMLSTGIYLKERLQGSLIL